MSHYPGVWYKPHKGWTLTEPMPVLIDEGRFAIPKGFKSDLASIPKILRVLPGMDCYECGIVGPVVHDWGYQHGGILSPTITVSRKRVDDLLRTLCRTDGVGRIRAFVVWSAVRMFGWFAWRRMPSRDRALWMAQ